ncbi:MAG: hypothetical protein KGJ80_16705 [Chloroflexota bacterium]|nr:hypothetical protein [Chloroflexota bacterium]
MSIALMVATSIVTGLAIRLLRRWPRLVFAAVLIGAAGLSAILFAAPSTPLGLFGRTLMLDAHARTFLWLAVGAAVALALFGLLTFEPADDSPAAIIANSQGAFFFWSLAPLVLAIGLDSFPLAVFFWALGLIVLMLLATPRREGRVGGAAQFLLLTVIASASLLLANRFSDLYPLTLENTDLIRNAVIFLALGLGLLLAVVPLHIWLGPLADEMPPLGTAFLVGVAQPVGLWLLFQLMSRTLWLTDKSPLLSVLIFGGGLTVPVGALLALSERRDGRFIAYLSLVSLGHALIGLGLGTRLGLAGAMLETFNRAIGVALVAGGLAFARHHLERRWQLIGAGAILVGGVTLAGIPPALGFAARWTIYRDLAGTNLPLVALLLAGSAATLFATLRVAALLLIGQAEPVKTEEVKIVPYLCAVVAVILLAIVLIGGFSPQLITDPLVAAFAQANYLK